MSDGGVLRLGTRGSPLALAQAKILSRAIESSRAGLRCELIPIQSTGDKKQGKLQVTRDKKDWILEFEEAILRGEIDFAVHSAKDVPVGIASGTYLLPCVSSEDPRDCLVVPYSSLVKAGVEGLIEDPGLLLSSLPANFIIGTSSLRRKAQLLAINEGLQCVEVRGNVNTRLQRLFDDGGCDALILAKAGLERLCLFGFAVDPRLSLIPIPIESILPAVNQGILVSQYSNGAVEKCLDFCLRDNFMHCRFRAERKLVQLLEADCNSALGVHCYEKEGILTLDSAVFSPDGAHVIRKTAYVQFIDDANYVELLATELSERVFSLLVASGARDLLFSLK